MNFRLALLHAWKALEKVSFWGKVSLNIPLFFSGQSLVERWSDRKSKHSHLKNTRRKIHNTKEKYWTKSFVTSLGLQTKFGQLHIFSAIFLLPVIQKNSVAVKCVVNYHQDLIIYFKLLRFLHINDCSLYSFLQFLSLLESKIITQQRKK